jgi:hypothetical protein
VYIRAAWPSLLGGQDGQRAVAGAVEEGRPGRGGG